MRSVSIQKASPLLSSPPRARKSFHEVHELTWRFAELSEK